MSGNEQIPPDLDNPGYRVLVAEDDYLVSEEIVRLLKELGYEHVGSAATGMQAVEMVHSLDPDVVLMDICMPEMDGLSAAKVIQQEKPTPIVVLTAHDSEEMVASASGAGVGAYLTKPPEKGELKRTIMIAVARHADLINSFNLCRQLEVKNQELLQALNEIELLKGLLPICSYCKKIRDDQGYWEQIDTYFQKKSAIEFTHGICPDCVDAARIKMGLKPKGGEKDSSTK